MKSPIVILHTDNPIANQEALARQHADLTIHTCDSYAALPALLAETQAEVVYSVRFAGTTDFPREALIKSDSIKWVSVAGSGTDHLNPWNPNQLTVTNAAGVAADMMAQYALGAMFHFSLNIPGMKKAQQQHQWINTEVEPIDGKTVLIVGLGKTGQAVAQRTQSLGLNTIGVRARPQATPYVDEVFHFERLPELFERADFIVVCVPLLENTRGLIGSDAFPRMKRNAVIIDVSRGGVIDEHALMAALDQNSIRGAALDVFTVEPLPTEHRLWDYDNVIISPHCSAVYKDWDLKSVAMFSDNLLRYRKGETLHNIVDPDRGY